MGQECFSGKQTSRKVHTILHYRLESKRRQKDERREHPEIPAAALQQFVIKFVQGVRR